MNRKNLTILAVCALVLLSCGKGKDKDDEAAGAENAAATPVQVAAVTTGSIDRVVEADAVDAARATISATVSDAMDGRSSLH